MAINSRLVHTVLEIESYHGIGCDKRSIYNLLKPLLYHSNADVCSDIFLYFLSKAYHHVATIQYTQHKQNKKQYYKYKYNLSCLLAGLHSDAVAGWSMLASFFYVHENYLSSWDIINYAVSKLTDEPYHICSTQNRNIMTPKQEAALDMMKKEKLITTLKSLTICTIRFSRRSNIIPKELQCDVRHSNVFLAVPFLHFLRFLCYYHLHDSVACEHAWHQLFLTTMKKFFTGLPLRFIQKQSLIFVGIAAQMTGQADMAKESFRIVAKYDGNKGSSAAIRLRELSGPSV